MKRLSLSVILAVLSLAIAPAVEAQGFLWILEVKIKPGNTEAYENYVKKIIEAHDKAKDPSYWAGYQVVAGKPGGTYRFVIDFEKWAEMDSSGSSNLVVLTSAFGEKEARRIQNEGTRVIESTMTRIVRVLPDTTANAPRVESQAKYYDVNVLTVREDMASEYQRLMRKAKDAYEAAPSKPIVYRGALVHGPSEGQVFYRFAPFNAWAERDQWNVGELLQDYFGAEEWGSMAKILQKARVRREHFVSRFRPDLSRAKPEAATN